MILGLYASKESKQNFANDPFRWDEESSTTQVSTEMVQTSFTMGPKTPPSSPNPWSAKPFTTSSDGQELIKAVTNMQMDNTRFQRCAYSQTPPENSSEASPTELCSPTPCHESPTNQISSQIVTYHQVQQFLDIFNKLAIKQEPPPTPFPPIKLSGESGEPRARASKLEFKTVNEVYVSKCPRSLCADTILSHSWDKKRASTQLRNRQNR